MTETEFPPVSFFLAPYGNLLLSTGAQGQRPRNHKYLFDPRNWVNSVKYILSFLLSKVQSIQQTMCLNTARTTQSPGPHVWSSPVPRATRLVVANARQRGADVRAECGAAGPLGVGSDGRIERGAALGAQAHHRLGVATGPGTATSPGVATGPGVTSGLGATSGPGVTDCARTTLIRSTHLSHKSSVPSIVYLSFKILTACMVHSFRLIPWRGSS